MGWRLSGKLKEKRLALLKLKDILFFLENKICVLGTPLIKAFEDVSKENVGGVWTCLFDSSSRIMRDRSLDAGAAWKAALAEVEEKLPLDRNEAELIADLGDLLGKSDKEMQHAVLNMEKEKISGMELRARETAETTGKLYRNLGALVGAAVVILLI